MFKADLGLKFMKIKSGMYTANSERNLILRYEYAVTMIQLL